MLLATGGRRAHGLPEKTAASRCGDASGLDAGSAAVFPFEMDTVVSLSGNRLVGTHYGFYNTIVGVGILAGNLATGTLMQVARDAGTEELIWVALAVVGLVSAAALYHLDRTGRLAPPHMVAPSSTT